MSGGLRHGEIGLLTEPLDLLGGWLGHPDEVVALGGLALIASVVVWLARRLFLPDARLRLWPVPAAISLFFLSGFHARFPSGRWLLHDSVHTCMALAPALLALAWFARARGRQLTMAGWLILPTLALSFATAVSWLWLDLSPGIDHSRLYLRAVGTSFHEVTNFLAAGLFVTGVVTAVSAFVPSARRLGHSHVLGTRGALLICFAGIFECHRGLLAAWYFNDFHAAGVIWALRNRLLLAAAGMAVLSLALGCRASRGAPLESRRQRRTATALSFLQLVMLATCFGMLELSAAWVLDTPGLMRAEPVCSGAPCTAQGSFWEYPPAERRYPLFRTDHGAIDVRYTDRAPAPTSRRTSPSPSTP
jgi:hypothetical protein